LIQQYRLLKSHRLVPENFKGACENLKRDWVWWLIHTFCPHFYPVLLEREIKTEWAVMAGDPLTVKTPDINSIAGDKMVAFAPNTTGVPYGLNKEKNR